jgi:hypothetical protein
MATTSYSFPSDLEDIGQRHFIRFNIVSIDSSTFAKNASKIGNSLKQFLPDNSVDGSKPHGSPVIAGITPLASQAAGRGGDLVSTVVSTVKDVGEKLIQNQGANLIGAGVGFGVGFGVNAARGALESVVPKGVAKVAGKVFDKLGGIFDGGKTYNEIFGETYSSVSEIKQATIDHIPIEVDKLVGVGSFPGAAPGQSAEDYSNTTGARKRSVGDILLYIPHSIQEAYQTNWSDGELGLAGALLESGVRAGSNDSTFKKALEEAQANLPGAAAEIGGKLLGAALSNPENIKQAALKAAGIQIDPHFTLFFTGVTPRTFTFDFKLSPRNQIEAQTIANIIRMFKLYSAPEANASTTRYWGYPNYFEIEYWNWAQTHRIKSCALTNITVNYTGHGDNHTFKDGYPIQTDLSLTFRESSLLTREDFLAPEGNRGGY